jgi:hypothetical protein
MAVLVQAALDSLGSCRDDILHRSKERVKSGRILDQDDYNAAWARVCIRFQVLQAVCRQAQACVTCAVSSG